jgi:surface antigen
MSRKSLITILVTSSLVISGCNTTKNGNLFTKENIGTAVGAGAGLLLGSQVGGGSGRTAAMLIGAISGGLLGKYIGQSLDEKDQAALAAQTQSVLESSQDGQVTQWQSEHSGATATITPLETKTVTKPVSMQRSQQVEDVQNITLLNAPYETIKGSNIRSAPTTSSNIVGSLAEGTTFTAIGRTDDDWLVVGRKGVNVGYIYAPLTQPYVSKPQPNVEQTAQVDTATDLDTMVIAKDDTKNSGFDLDNMQITTEQVATKSQCRTLQYDIKTDTSSDVSQVEACQSSDGSWELV